MIPTLGLFLFAHVGIVSVFCVDESQPPTQQHWAFKPPTRPPAPLPKDNSWGHNPIDSFIGFEHGRRGIVPAPEAARRTLIRRLSLDLIGLPPSPEEIDAFEADPEPEAYARLVERLLSSPHYGERWGRHWLDLARWAESDGYEANDVRSSAWRYRDYVVRSFNQDKPYDQFLREQIAGDEIVPYSDENLVATGFLAAGRLNNNEEDKAIQRNESLVDIVNATATVTLGLTLNCAQCHDHKFDDLTANDYYRFQGFFVQGQVNALLLKDPAQWKAYEASIPPELDSAKSLRKLIYDPVRARLMEEARQRLTKETREAFNRPPLERTPEQQDLARKAEKELNIPKDKIEKALSEDDQKLFRELDKKISTIEKQLTERKPQAWGFYSPATSPARLDALPPRGMYPLPYDPQKLKAAKPRLLRRGDIHRPGAELEAAWPTIFGVTPSGLTEKAPRLALANWLTSPTNPLVARVWVNYLWQQHFGRGIVATPGDFGVRGAKPTHPELLDWLATELIRSGWRAKHIHRLIVQSSTYRQASVPHALNSKTDPDNQFLWRWPMRRLEAETIRDLTLAASGELDPIVGGPSVLPEEDQKRLRRSLYLRQKRHELPATQTLFDAPSANESCPQRHVSTISLQPLHLMNNQFVLDRAEKFAARVMAMAGGNRGRQIETAFRIALGRAPDQTEAGQASAFLARGSKENAKTNSPDSSSQGGDEPNAWVHFCHALLNLNEFIYIE